MILPHAVVIGASSGGVAALLALAAALPPGFRAIVAVVLHVGSQHSILPELMSQRGPNRAVHPRDGQPPVPGIIYVAPPDHHLLLTPDAIRLNRGARENHARPAIDPLFRSAALGWHGRAIGVVLTGDLNDGTAGLAAIKHCGGTAIVQDPATAFQPSMPASARAHVAVDHCLPLAQIAPTLLRLVCRPAETPGAPPERLVREEAAYQGERPVANLSAIGTPSSLTCPECGGSLWESNDGRLLRYRCHTGHAYTALSLDSAQAAVAHQGMWSSLRLLRERELLLRRLAAVAESIGDPAQAQAGRHQADRVHKQAQRLCQPVQGKTTGLSADARMSSA